MRVRYLNHASLLLTGQRCTLMTDPFLWLEPVLRRIIHFYPGHNETPQSIGPLKYLYCSHEHFDHSHVPTLNALKKNVDTVLLPERQPMLEARVRACGFKKLVMLPPEKTVELDGVRVTNVPHPNGCDNALFVEMDGVTVMHANDCVLSPETLGTLGRRFTVDVAFTPHTCVQDLYPLLLPRPREELMELGRHREAVEVKRILDGLVALKPRRVVPYSFTVAYAQPDQTWTNAVGRTLPHEFRALLQACLPETPCLLMQPGDRWDSVSNKVSSRRKTSVWEKSFHEAQARVARGEVAPWTDGSAGECDVMLRRHFGPRAPWPRWRRLLRGGVVELTVHGDDGTRVYSVDTKAGAFVNGSSAAPLLRVRASAFMLSRVLDGTYDAFMALYSLRATQHLKGAPLPNPRMESDVYENIFQVLFGGAHG